jgi:hypothetical protein
VRAISRCPARLPRHRLRTLVRGTGFDGDVIVFAAMPGDLPEAGRVAPADRPSRRRSRGRPLDVGHDLGAEGRRAHAPERCGWRPTRSRPRTTCAPAKRCCCRCRSRTSPASPTASCSRSRRRSPRCSWTRGSRPARSSSSKRENIAVMISTPVFMRTMIDHPAFDAPTRVGAAVLARRRGSRARDGARRRASVRLLVQAHLRLDRVPDAHDRPARRRPRTRRDHRRLPHRPRPSCASSTRRRSPTSRPARPASSSRADPRCSSATSIDALDTDAFVDGGWFRTGDLAVYDGEYLTIVDRLKDIIIRGGENISAQEVEALLVTHPDVAEAACVASPDPVMGEKVCAFVIADRRRADARRAARASRRTGARPVQAAVALEVRAELPRTASGKVQKAPLRAELAEERADDRRARVHRVGPRRSSRRASRRAVDRRCRCSAPATTTSKPAAATSRARRQRARGAVVAA